MGWIAGWHGGLYCMLIRLGAVHTAAACRPATWCSVRNGLCMSSALRHETDEDRKARKERVKADKQAKRARRQGFVPEGFGNKPCTICSKGADLLIRYAVLMVSWARHRLCCLTPLLLQVPDRRHRGLAHGVR